MPIRKSKRRSLFIEIRGSGGETLTACSTPEYALPEPEIIRLSAEYFNDPEPCEIHRAAVLKRVMLELIDACGIDQTVCVDLLSDAHRRCLPEGAASVRIREESV